MAYNIMCKKLFCQNFPFTLVIRERILGTYFWAHPLYLFKLHRPSLVFQYYDKIFRIKR